MRLGGIHQARRQTNKGKHMTTASTAPEATDYLAPEVDESLDARPESTIELGLVASGWAAAESLTPPSEGFPTEYKHLETPQVLKFVDETGPFAIFKMHFLSGKPGKKSYVCLNSNGGNSCPLCSVLHNRAEDKRAFTVINFSAEGGPERQILVATPRFWKTIHTAHFSPQGPLTKNYWAVSRTGKMQSTVYHMQAIKARDLQEDWAIDEAAAEKVVSEAVSFEAKLYRETPYAELLEIANEMLNV
jgi:hypothetical protein